jgi:predicted lysophospholipase L1 biosynthesis ABC-type transport system permease subunit
MAILFALVGLILLIACTNVGGILLARGVTRAREIGVRLALGARRGRVVQLLVIESILLGATGSVVGIALALVCIRLLHAMVPLLPIALGIDVRLDWHAVAFSVVVSVAAGALSGLLPALQTSRIDFVATVRSDASSDTRGRTRLRQAFIISQLAMSVPLVVVAMLLGRSRLNTNTIDPGFEVERQARWPLTPACACLRYRPTRDRSPLATRRQRRLNATARRRPAGQPYCRRRARDGPADR